MSKFVFFRVTREMANTKRDKRKTTGFYALQTIPAGTLVRMRPSTDKYAAASLYILRPGKTTGMCVPYDCTDSFLPSGGFVQTTEPKGAAEILFGQDIDGEAFDCILVKLFEMGAINAENLTAAVESVRADWDKEA